jgi:hypothetical protein
MNSPNSPARLSSQSARAVRIECAFDCDGESCHQPFYKDDGGLNPIVPHHHLVEVRSGVSDCFAIWGLTPGEVEFDQG